jgi:hypothetical protein
MAQPVTKAGALSKLLLLATLLEANMERTNHEHQIIRDVTHVGQFQMKEFVNDIFKCCK